MGVYTIHERDSLLGSMTNCAAIVQTKTDMGSRAQKVQNNLLTYLQNNDAVFAENFCFVCIGVAVAYRLVQAKLGVMVRTVTYVITMS